MQFTAQPSQKMVETLTEPPTARNPNPKPTFGTVRIAFSGETNVGIKPLKAFVLQCQSDYIHTGILITKVAPTSASTKITQSLDPKEQIIEIFQESELVVNITLHELVPKHVLLSFKEKAELLERYRLKESQLPRIQRSDPVAKYFGLKRGQVVKIIRKSETAGRYASYRWCI
jgi:DNA-directed RNA polymerase I, II, and III subunit RPABC1